MVGDFGGFINYFEKFTISRFLVLLNSCLFDEISLVIFSFFYSFKRNFIFGLAICTCNGYVEDVFNFR